MKSKFSLLMGDLFRVIKNNPVEMLVGFTCFILAILEYKNKYSLSDQFYFLAPLCMVLSFILNRTLQTFPIRMIYYLSYFLILIQLPFDLSDFTRSSGYWYSLLVAAILLVSYRFHKDNQEFAKDAVRTLIHLFSGVLIGIAFYLIVIGIYFSLTYIFDLSLLRTGDFYLYLFWFTFYVAGPLSFLFFEKFSVNKRFETSGIFAVLLNYILTPALLIYTVILYLYFAKIIIMWELPMGGVAYLVFAFVLVSAIGKVCQHLLVNRLYDWFYNRFSLISLPLLCMFWVGVYYRLSEYGVTENRIYLLIAGVVITLFAVLFLFPATSRYVYISSSAVILFSLFIFIPGIAARDLDKRYRLPEKEREWETVSHNRIQRYYYYLDPVQVINISGYRTLIRMQNNSADTEKQYEVSFDENTGNVFLATGSESTLITDINQRLWESASRHGIDLTDSLLTKRDLQPCVDDLRLIHTEEVLLTLERVDLVRDSVFKVNAINVDMLFLK